MNNFTTSSLRLTAVPLSIHDVDADAFEVSETDFDVALHLREAFAVDAEKQTAFVEILSELRRCGFRRDALVETRSRKSPSKVSTPAP